MVSKLLQTGLKPLVFGLLILSFFFHLHTWNEMQTGKSSNYYRHEYNTLLRYIDTKSPFESVATRGWRRGPLDYLWLYPLAYTFGSSLKHEWIYIAQLLVVLGIALAALKAYWRREESVFYAAAFVLVILSCTALRYRLLLADINSLIGFALLPLLALNSLKDDRPIAAGIIVACSAHFRVLSIALMPYFFLRDRRTLLPAVLTTLGILGLGTLVLSPEHGYLYWFTLFRDVLFASPNEKASYSIWEVISMPSIFIKTWNHFYYHSRTGFQTPLSTEKVLIRCALLTQFTAIAGLLYWSFQNRRFEKALKITGENLRNLRVLEIGCMSTLTYFLAAEYGSDFCITLYPLFLSAIFVLFHLPTIILWYEAFGLLLGWIMTFNIVGPALVAKVFFLETLSRCFGVTFPFSGYELLSAYNVPTLGIFLTTLILLRIAERYKKKLSSAGLKVQAISES